MTDNHVCQRGNESHIVDIIPVCTVVSLLVPPAVVPGELYPVGIGYQEAIPLSQPVKALTGDHYHAFSVHTPAMKGNDKGPRNRAVIRGRYVQYESAFQAVMIKRFPAVAAV